MKATCLLLLLAASPLFADSISIFDINHSGNLVLLTPSTVVELTSPQGDGIALFQATTPSNWTRGEAFTLTICFDGLSFGASGNAYMNYVEFGFEDTPDGISLPGLTQPYPATVTISFANGGSATEQFIIAPVPEPGTWVLLGSGLLLLGLRRITAPQSRPNSRQPRSAGPEHR